MMRIDYLYLLIIIMYFSLKPVHAQDSYEAQLKALEAENRQKEIYKKQIDEDWQKLLSIVKENKENLSKSIEVIQLFLNKYHQHPFGNSKQKEAQNLLDKLVFQEEKERKNILAKEHLAQVKKSYDSVKAIISKGDDLGKKSLDGFLQEYHHHPLGNPLSREAQIFYENARYKKEQEDRLKHLKIVEDDWKVAKVLVAKGDSYAKNQLDLFLKKYESHPFGNPLAREAQMFYEQKHLKQEILLKIDDQIKIDHEWDRLMQAIKNGGPTAVKVIELFLQKYQSNPFIHQYQSKAEDILLDIKENRKIEYRTKTHITWVFIKGGSFMMGNNNSYENREKPVHKVEVKDFYLTKTRITVGQYRKCVDAGVCTKPSCGWTNQIEDEYREFQPVACTDWNQSRTFAQWIGGDLPTEVQWEYASKSGGQDKFVWGNEIHCKYIKNYEDPMCGYWLSPASEICDNPDTDTHLGLCLIRGMGSEWLLDEWHQSYKGAPSTDIAWCSDSECKNQSKLRVVRNSNWYCKSSGLRQSSSRHNSHVDSTYDLRSFRVAITTN